MVVGGGGGGGGGGCDGWLGAIRGAWGACRADRGRSYFDANLKNIAN